MEKIREIDAGEARVLVKPLANLLIDAVASGASVGFLPPLGRDEAAAYWISVGNSIAAGQRILLVAEHEGQIVGAVQLTLELRANGRHRAEVSKLLVHTGARRQGIGRALMLALEQIAATRGRTTLVLDTRLGDPSELLYLNLGYLKAGVIPQYARSAGGELHATAFFYKLLA
jgi:ribosomal protein S18 acetylase RimI-like enzyme